MEVDQEQQNQVKPSTKMRPGVSPMSKIRKAVPPTRAKTNTPSFFGVIETLEERICLANDF